MVYGDIGTSVLMHAQGEVFRGGRAVHADNVCGVLSIFFWTLTIIVSVKYVTWCCAQTTNGEGGLVAMLALASHR